MSRPRTSRAWLPDGEYEIWEESDMEPSAYGFVVYTLWVKSVAHCEDCEKNDE